MDERIHQLVNIRLEGDDQIIQMLRGLEKEVDRKKILSKAIRAGAKPIIKSARQKIRSFDFEKDTKGKFKKKYTKPVNSTVLKKSMGVVIRKGRRFNDWYGVVGPKVGGANDGWFAHWIEYGTLAKRTEPLEKGRQPGAQKAADKGLGFRKNPFLRPALFQQDLKAKKIILEIVLKEVQAYWEAKKRKYGVK